MSNMQSGYFSNKGGNCLLVIMENFSKIGGKSLAEISSEGGKTTRNKICWVDILLGESSLGSI